MIDPLAQNPLFPATAWSAVRRVQSGPGEVLALEQLCKIYWRPVCQFIMSLGCPPSAAEDVTQDFFASFLKGGGFRMVSPEAGKLRTLLKQAARHHLASMWRHKLREKRGGTEGTLSLGDLEEVQTPRVEAEAAYDRDWALATLDSALGKLEAYYATRGREAFFNEIKEGLLRPGGVADAAGKARHLGITESQVRLAVHRARHRLGLLLREEVAATLVSPEEAQEEVQHLLSLLSQEI